MTHSEPQSNVTKLQLAKIAASQILGYYPSPNVNDPEMFTAGFVSILSDYPESVIYSAADPKTGIVANHRFLPNIAELRTWCEAAVAPVESARKRQEVVRETLSRRNDDGARLLLAAPVGEEPARPTLDDIRAKYGPNWGLKTVDDPELPKAHRARMKSAAEKTNAAILEDWGDQTPPTICGVPISKTLDAVLRRTRD